MLAEMGVICSIASRYMYSHAGLRLHQGASQLPSEADAVVSGCARGIGHGKNLVLPRPR